MRVAALSFIVALIFVASGTPPLSASGHSIDFDHQTNFSVFKTFLIHDGSVDTPRPELNNPLFVKMMADAIRDELIGKGLKETADRPDVIVDDRMTVADVSTVEGRRGMFVPPGQRERGVYIPAAGPTPVRYVHGTLVIDLTTPGNNLLVWRGTFQDDVSNGSTLARELPGDVKTLTSDYPPKP
jgi:hypothetical protein